MKFGNHELTIRNLPFQNGSFEKAHDEKVSYKNNNNNSSFCQDGSEIQNYRKEGKYGSDSRANEKARYQTGGHDS